MKHVVSLLLILCSTAQAGLINVQPSPNPSPIPLTLAQKQSQTRLEIRMSATKGFVGLKDAITDIFYKVWHNNGLTPQEVFDGLRDGTQKNGCAAHQLFISVKALLNAASPGSFTLTESCPVSCNSDGSVTVSCPAPSPIPSESP